MTTIFEKETSMEYAEAKSYEEFARATLLGTRIAAWAWLIFALISVISFFVSIWLPVWGYNVVGPATLSALMMVIAFIIRPKPVEVDLHGNDDNS